MIKMDRPDREYLIEVHPALLEKLGNTVENVLEPFYEAGYKVYTVGNDYEPINYLCRGEPQRPQRLEAELDRDTNLILSREDRNEL